MPTRRSTEVGQWRRSTRCSAADCVEVAITPDAVLVRDSKDRDGPVLALDREAWRSFLQSL